MHSVEDFLDEYLKSKQINSFDKEGLKQKFEQMLAFVKANFEYGFKKSKNANSTPRGRFEAIAVGVALAQKEESNLNKLADKNEFKLNTNVQSWINLQDFKDKTTSDGANNKSKLTERIEYVRNKLLANE